MKLLKSIFTGLGVVLFAFLTFTYSCQITGTDGIPGAAQVIVDDDMKEYHAPLHHFYENKLEDHKNLRVLTLQEARAISYKVDFKCEHNFEDKTESLLWVLLRGAGITPKMQSRVNSDGTWNY